MVHRVDGCHSNMTEETLRGWRTGELSDDEARNVAAHVAGCLSCQVAMSLLDIKLPAPRPAASIPAASQSLVRRIPRSRLTIAGIAAVAAAIVIVSSLALTLGATGASHPGSAGPSPTSVALATGTPSPTPASTRAVTPTPGSDPTPTPTPTTPGSPYPLITSYLTPSQAWGQVRISHLLLTSFPLATDVFPDASALIGTNGGNISTVSLPSLTVHLVTVLPITQTEPDIVTDGTYAGYVTGAGHNSGSQYDEAVGYVSLATGAITTIDTLAAYTYAVPYGADHGYFLWTEGTSQSVFSLRLTNMANGVTTIITTQASARVAPQLSWPYVLYATPANVVRLYNGATKKDVTLPQITEVSASASCCQTIALSGDTVYWVSDLAHLDGNQVIQAIAHAGTPGATSTPVVIVPYAAPGIQGLQASGRFLAWLPGVLWDLTDQRAINLNATASYDAPQVVLHGQALLYTTQTSGQAQYNICNTTLLP